MGWTVLEGGNEFNGRMADADREAMRLAGGSGAAVRIIPAAAAPDGNHERAGRRGAAWFRALGARDVRWLPVVDRGSADLPELAGEVRGARLVYLLGGFPGHLADTLSESAVWRAVLEAHGDGAVVAGSSAGAMVLCEAFYDPFAEAGRSGLGLVPGAFVVPHFDGTGRRWAETAGERLRGLVLMGIDEETGVVDDGRRRTWRVWGRGRLTVVGPGGASVFGTGEVYRAGGRAI